MLSLHSCPLGKLGARDTGGMNVYVRELAQGLGDMGHMVDIYTRAHNSGDLLITNISKNVRLIHIRAGLVGDLDKMTQFAHLNEFVQGMLDFVEAEGTSYDLIHSHYWLSGLAGQRLSGILDVPQVMTFHTLGAIKNGLPIEMQEPKERLDAESFIALGCQHVIATTEEEKSWLGRTYGVQAEKISVVPCGVNLSLFCPMARSKARLTLEMVEGEKIILSVGRIEPLKGLTRLVEAMNLLRRSDLRLLVIGGDTYSTTEIEGLKALAAKLGLSSRVEFLKAIEQKLLPLYYSAVDITVVTSYYESFCLIILESLACGTPVVSTRVGVAPEVINKTSMGRIVDGTPEALAQALTQILEETGDSDMVNIRRMAVQAYGWAKVSERMAVAYEAVLV